jgi:hypothetical protein
MFYQDVQERGRPGEGKSCLTNAKIRPGLLTKNVRRSNSVRVNSNSSPLSSGFTLSAALSVAVARLHSRPLGGKSLPATPALLPLDGSCPEGLGRTRSGVAAVAEAIRRITGIEYA